MRTRAWLVSYGLLGLTQNGLVPVLMPLVSAGNEAAGVTYAVFSLLGLSAPLLGSWADRTGRHRDLLIWGTVGSGLALLLFDAATASLRIMFAAAAGLGATAATTAGNVLVIQGLPEAEWDSRVALLQRFVSAGQVVGLTAAGVLARSLPGEGFVFAGVALLAAGVLAFVSAPGHQPRGPRDKPAPKPMVGGDAGTSGPHHHGHHLSWQELVAYLRVINRPLRRFLIIWLIAYPTMNGLATLFPVAMTRQFGMNPILPSISYAIGVAASLLLYAPVGRATHRLHGERMLMFGFSARLVLFGALAILSLPRAWWSGWSVLVGFALVQLVWPLLSVAANSLSVRLAPAARGESVGLFNAATSLASSVGSALAGVIFGVSGFPTLAAAAFVAVGVALTLTAAWLPRTRGNG